MCYLQIYRKRTPIPCQSFQTMILWYYKLACKWQHLPFWFTQSLTHECCRFMNWQAGAFSISSQPDPRMLQVHQLAGWSLFDLLRVSPTNVAGSSTGRLKPFRFAHSLIHEYCRFINWQAEAICRADRQALVTAGSWSQNSQTDQLGKKNLYTDHCLVTAGGKANVS